MQKMKPFYVIVTRYEKPGKRPITHVYGSHGGWTKSKADAEKRKLLKNFREEHPHDNRLSVSVLRLVDIELLNSNIHRVEADAPPNIRHRELQGPHQGPSGEQLI